MGAQRGRDVFGGRSSGHVFAVPEDVASVLECAVRNWKEVRLEGTGHTHGVREGDVN